MSDRLPVSPSTSPTANTPVASLRERSSADLTRQIHGPSDEAYTLDRTRACLRLYFEADMLPEERAAMIEEFGRALRDLPRWTIARAFDGWIKTGKRRPTPAEIRALAEAQVKPLTDEIARRQREAAPPPDHDRQPVDRDAAAEIMARAGFTPARMEAIRHAPMANTWAEAETPAAPRRQSMPIDDAYMAAVRAARAANPLIQAGTPRNTDDGADA